MMDGSRVADTNALKVPSEFRRTSSVKIVAAIAPRKRSHFLIDFIHD
jgi:hypothetical protein